MNVLFLGNEHLHQLTSQGKYNLRINMEDFDNTEKYATYKQFAVDDEKSVECYFKPDIRRVGCFILIWRPSLAL
jgi:hypothetical protein